MKLAIVGSVSLEGNPQARAEIRNYIEELEATTVISGGATGIDSMAAEIALNEYDLPVVVHFPDHPSWPSYKKRNLLIAMECDQLVRIVAKSSKTYGSGWTRDRAREMGKPVFEVVIDA